MSRLSSEPLESELAVQVEYDMDEQGTHIPILSESLHDI
jgi:hypothetical protein